VIEWPTSCVSLSLAVTQRMMYGALRLSSQGPPCFYCVPEWQMFLKWPCPSCALHLTKPCLMWHEWKRSLTAHHYYRLLKSWKAFVRDSEKHACGWPIVPVWDEIQFFKKWTAVWREIQTACFGINAKKWVQPF